MMKVVVTNGPITHVKLQSNFYHQQTNTHYQKMLLVQHEWVIFRLKKNKILANFQIWIFFTNLTCNISSEAK